MPDNYTSIDHLIPKPQHTGAGYHPEHPSFSKPEAQSEPQEQVEFEAVHEDVKPHVDVKPETIQVPPDLKQLGVEPVESLTYKTHKPLQLPLSDEKIEQGLHAPVSSSFRWLATFALHLLNHAHLTLRMIQGKPTRVPMK